MKPQKIKRYRLSVSRTFPATHPRQGEETKFIDYILNALDTSPYSAHLSPEELKLYVRKCHTIRANYELWAKRMAEVQAGRAVIELCYWSDKPYRSKQVVFATLDKDSGCGVQKLASYTGWLVDLRLDDEREMPFVDLKTLAKNDGLLLDDFKAWFKGYDLSHPMAIIHFTDFRY